MDLISAYFCSRVLVGDSILKFLSFSPSRLHSLRSLSLHNNLLTYLPREILCLVHLQELSLRGNPLVVRFVKEMTYDPPSLLELAGRTIKSRNIPYYPCDLPANLLYYLDLASKCPNPKCAGKTFCFCFCFFLNSVRRKCWCWFVFLLWNDRNFLFFCSNILLCHFSPICDNTWIFNHLK